MIESLIIHKGLLESGSWFKMSLVEQMANIGCDVERAIRWRDRGDKAASQAALFRALELIDFLTLDPKNRKRLKEPRIMRELLVDYFMYDNVYKTTDQFLQKYFINFNYMAALERGR